MPPLRRELIGYADPLSVAPGNRMQVMVSSEFLRYRASLVRLIHGDTNPRGPGRKEEAIESVVDGEYEGVVQLTFPGSYVHVPADPRLANPGSFTLQGWIKPTTPAEGRIQGIMGCRGADGGKGYGLALDPTGALALRIGDEMLSTETPLRTSMWHFAAATYDATNGAAHVESRLVAPWPLPDARAAVATTMPRVIPADGAPFLIGAGAPVGTPGRRGAIEAFNGRVDSPRVLMRALDAQDLEILAAGEAPGECLAVWDFSAGIGTSRVPDGSGSGFGGTAVNHPTRGVTGFRWDGSAFHWREAPDQYTAIHFHADDLDDCEWDVSLDFRVPENLRSGFYAVKLEADGTEDHVPFFVRPPRGQAMASIAYLVPTHNYLAYANESVLLRDDFDFTTMTNMPVEVDPYDRFLQQHPEYGASLYDLHRDGSGVHYTTTRRPIVSMRPGHRHWVHGAPRHYSADLYLVDWLEEKGFSYDVITDGDLHAEGKQLLERYPVVLTGSHPEYWTTAALDSLQEYLHDGGSLMYLGGNGFYWVIAVDPEARHVLEVRRGVAGSRCWESHPGEVHLASTGELGGIWRHRGRPPNLLVGNGFSGQGWDRSPGYRRLPDSHDERAAFIFEGVEVDVIGDFGLVLGGAAGEEVDRFDFELGTPPHALRLATSEGMHSDAYLVTHEDFLVTTKEIDGSTSRNLRADLVYFENPRGGAVFSVGSMTWIASLSHNNYDNNVSRITENVLKRFLG